MIQDSYLILVEMVSSFKNKLSDINARISEYTISIREEKSCVKEFEDSEADDFKIFYPRKDSTPAQKAEAEKAYLRIAECEEEIGKLNEIKTDLENKISQLESVLKNETHNISLINFQEEDRRRIVRDLHDDSLQNLIHLIHKLELCNLYIDQDPLKAKLELSLVSKGLKEVIGDIRNTIFDLRPMSFEDLGMKAGFERLLNKINEERKYEVVSDIENVSCENKLVLTYIYRIVQECLANIDKHAKASRIFFQCKVDGQNCVIDVEDDGIGFDEETVDAGDEKHFGLSLMRERISFLDGTIKISSHKGNGTKVHMTIPLVKE